MDGSVGDLGNVGDLEKLFAGVKPPSGFVRARDALQELIDAEQSRWDRIRQISRKPVSSPVEANERTRQLAQLHSELASLKGPKAAAEIRLISKYPGYAQRIERQLLPLREMLARLLGAQLNRTSSLVSQLDLIEKLLRRVKSERTVPMGWSWSRTVDPRSASQLVDMVAPPRRARGE
jgi:hypothetical protein